jgi:hypothetical protein
VAAPPAYGRTSRRLVWVRRSPVPSPPMQQPTDSRRLRGFAGVADHFGFGGTALPSNAKSILGGGASLVAPAEPKAEDSHESRCQRHLHSGGALLESRAIMPGAVAGGPAHIAPLLSRPVARPGAMRCHMKLNWPRPAAIRSFIWKFSLSRPHSEACRNDSRKDAKTRRDGICEGPSNCTLDGMRSE